MELGLKQEVHRQAARGYGLVIAATALHAAVPVAGKYAMGTMAPMTYSFLYVAFAAVFGFAYLALTTDGARINAQLRARWRTLAVMGAVQALGAWTFFAGLSLVDPTVAAFFGRSAAVFAVILAVAILRERMNGLEMAGVSLSIGGSLLISYGGGRVVFGGMLLIMTSGLCFAVFTLIAKMRVRGVEPVLLVAGPCAAAALILAPVGIAAGGFDFAVPAGAYWAVAAAAFFGDFLGISTFYRALRYVGFAVASAMRSAHPLFVAVLAYFTLRTAPDAWGWIGGAIIIAGVLAITAGGARRRADERLEAAARAVAAGDEADGGG